MRCPKCHYLSFDPEPRCKNCGYDLEVADTELTLATPERPTPADDLPLRVVESQPRAITLELVKPVLAPAAVAPVLRPRPEPALVAVAVEPAPPKRAPARAPHTTTELPLFVKAIDPSDVLGPAPVERTPPVPVEPAWPGPAQVLDRRVETRAARMEQPPPIVTMPAASRPLSVRRPVPDPSRTAPPRVERRVGPLDHDLLEDLRRLEREEALQSSIRRHGNADISGATEEVTLSQRWSAAALDGLLLGGIGTFVLWATLRLCQASLGDLGAAALVPFGVFLAVVAVAYLLMFTAAGGQTVGKMLIGIRVVGDAPDSGELTIGQATSRALLAPLSAAALGLGWVPALFGGLSIHDRLAHTRVVRA